MYKSIVIAFLIAAAKAEATTEAEIAGASEIAAAADCSANNVKCASDHCCGTGVLVLGTASTTPTMVCSTTVSANPDKTKYELWKCNSEAKTVGALKTAALSALSATVLAAFWTL